MRKIIYLIAVVFALGSVSCTKQEVHPDVNAVSNEPVWRSSEGGCGDDSIKDEDEDDLIVDPVTNSEEEEAANSNNAN